MLLKSVMLAVSIATLLPLWLIYLINRLEQHFQLISPPGIANTYDVRKQVGVKAHWFPLDITGKQPVVSIANTAMWYLCLRCMDGSLMTFRIMELM